MRLDRDPSQINDDAALRPLLRRGDAILEQIALFAAGRLLPRLTNGALETLAENAKSLQRILRRIIKGS